MRLTDRELCDCVASIESWFHILCDSPLYESFMNLEAMAFYQSDGGCIVTEIVKSPVKLEVAREYSSRLFACLPHMSYLLT